MFFKFIKAIEHFRCIIQCEIIINIRFSELCGRVVLKLTFRLTKS